MLAVALVALGTVAFGPVSASGDTPELPTFNGATDFPSIHGPSDPEEFSWQVTVHPTQTLKLVDAHHAEVRYEDGTVAWTIVDGLAHDVTGAGVPTSLAVSGGDVVTLTVHHRDGNPAAGGASFSYPVDPGAPYTVGNSTVTITYPPGESGRPAQFCVVPKLKGLSLRASKNQLRSAECRIGKVGKAKGVKARIGRVVKQSPVPGQELAVGAEVDVRLGR